MSVIAETMFKAADGLLHFMVIFRADMAGSMLCAREA